SPRKLRLFAAACCRRVWDLLCGDEYRDLLAFAERCADDSRKSRSDELRRLAVRIYEHPQDWMHAPTVGFDDADAEHAVLHLAGAPPGAVRGSNGQGRPIFASATEEVLSPTYLARCAAEHVARALARRGTPAAGATARVALRETSVSLASR